MNPTDYVEASERTERKFPEGLELSADNVIVFRHLTDDLTQLGIAMDHMKKHLVYGAGCEILPPASAFKGKSVQLDSFQAELLHHGMGKITEAIECYEAIMNHVNGGEIDTFNIAEEIFDGHWYDAGLCRLLNISFEMGWDTNLAKLFKRFPDAFNKDDAMIRDLIAERAILESDNSTSADAKAVSTSAVER